MNTLKSIAFVIIALYIVIGLLLYFFQTRLIFHPGKLSKDFRFRLQGQDEEITLTTSDHEKINALFYPGEREEVVLYFHGNAGDLSGWQFVSEYFTTLEYNFFIPDYRGYGKSSGDISEKGFYNDAEAAYNFLVHDKGFAPENIIVYGRSIGSGVAVESASKYPVKGLVLEAPYTSLKKLTNEKVPLFFPSFYLRYHFNNEGKIKKVKCPVVLLHGERDELIPAQHSKILFQQIQTKKELILIPEGQHNDLNSTAEYLDFLKRLGDF